MLALAQKRHIDALPVTELPRWDLAAPYSAHLGRPQVRVCGALVANPAKPIAPMR